MQEVNRNGVLIDVCPTCRGVWLDRGELEKLLSYIREDNSGQQDDYRSGDKRDDNRDNDDYKYKGKKKRSLLDFFDL
jgi:Zn-finger nucleic acid-binding protein